ncbi:hypothetical protein V5T82_07305 [Magnetovibrio sp. PR-2]|uniref:hypothetical protein n=1 Tax=Magnetovibrio sp. PR-2 TaxID=3120356 RepID=UPI002FCDFB17
MSVLSQDPRLQYTAAVDQTIFTIAFRFLQDDDVDVYVDGTLQTDGVDYNLSGAGDVTGGECTFVSPMTGGEEVTIYRNMDLSRSADYQQKGPFRSSVVNNDLDRIWMAMQGLDESITRTINFAVTSRLDLPIDFPDPLADHYIGWDHAGENLVNKDLNGLVQVPVSEFFEPVLLANDYADFLDLVGASPFMQTLLQANNTTEFQGAVGTINAYYADLAEMYRAQFEIKPGTVVRLSDHDVYEIEPTNGYADDAVFGVISTEPHTIMNHMKDRSEHWLPVALTGRVPCRVIGPVKKGDRLVPSQHPGVGQSGQPGRGVFARALETKTSGEVGLIEVAIVTTN